MHRWQYRPWLALLPPRFEGALLVSGCAAVVVAVAEVVPWLPPLLVPPKPSLSLFRSPSTLSLRGSTARGRGSTAATSSSTALLSGSTALCRLKGGGYGWIGPPTIKGGLLLQVDLPLFPQAPLLLQSSFSPDLSP